MSSPAPNTIRSGHRVIGVVGIVIIGNSRV